MVEKKDKQNFIELAKNKAKELGISVTDAALNHVNEITALLQASIGNELVLATFVPMIPSLIADKVKRKIFDKHVSNLGNRLNEHFADLNKDFIQSLEGRRIFQNLIEEIINKADEKKIEYLKNFIISVYIDKDPQEVVIRRSRTILLQMDQSHIQLLSALVKPARIIRKAVEDKPNPRKSHFFMPGDFNKYFMKLPDSVFESLYNDLKNWGLVDDQHDTRSDGEQKGVYTTQVGFWKKNQVLHYGKIKRKHSKKFVEENLEITQLNRIDQTILGLTSITINYITDFGWEFYQKLEN